MYKISIIVPIYNSEKTLGRCIDSILNQTFTDFELILVDDGSLDNSGKICDEYAQLDSRIRVIHQKNAGVSTARNAGLDMSSGTYIMFCDSDDWVEPDWCECLYDGITKNDVVMALCGFKMYDEENRCIKENVLDCRTIELKQMIETPMNSVPWNKIFIASKIKEHNIKFPNDISLGEDIYFFLTYISTFEGTDKFFYSGSVLYNYIVMSGSLGHKYVKEHWNIQRDLLSFQIEVAKKHNSDISKYDKIILDKYCGIILYSINHIFNIGNNSSPFEKLKEIKKILTSYEFEQAKKSERYTNLPFWYRFLLKHRITPLLYFYHIIRR